MQKTHRPHHRSCALNDLGDFLNLLPIAQRVRHGRAFGDAADTTLHDGDALFDFLGRAFLSGSNLSFTNGLTIFLILTQFAFRKTLR